MQRAEVTDRPRLWHMNADFEAELAAYPSAYHPKPTIARRNARLSKALLWLAAPGDALIVCGEPSSELLAFAGERGVVLAPRNDPGDQSSRDFCPWGWTPSAVALGQSARARIDAPAFEIVRRVNSKLFSHRLEGELGIATSGTRIARSMDELHDAAAAACPGTGDKWVVKGEFGFAARERVLGRGPAIDEPSAKWAARRFAAGETLLFEPWLDVTRELGVQLVIGRDKRVNVAGVSTMMTNGAGVTTGFVLGLPVARAVRDRLEAVGVEVGRRLAAEGYFGPANVDAFELGDGLRPLVEINARHTMGLVALAVERATKPSSPANWSP